MKEILKSSGTYDIEVKYLPICSNLILEQKGMYKNKDLISLELRQMEQLHAILTQILLREKAK
jgi:hypothetical protein